MHSWQSARRGLAHSISFVSIASLVLVISIGVFIIARQGALLSIAQHSSRLHIATQTIPARVFQTGIVFPGWTPTAYSVQDSVWQDGIRTMHAQTGARWIEIPLLFFQDTLTATTVKTGVSTPTCEAFAEGVRAAHALGYRVFVTPLLQVNGRDTWAGDIHFSMRQQMQQWFISYWQTLEPYVEVAEQNQVEQFAIGTEEEWLQQHADTTLWNTLLAQFRATFSRTLTYDTNWTALQVPVPSWMHSSTLTMLGVSEYIPLTQSPVRIDPTQLVQLWHTTITPLLDQFAHNTGKPLLLSEIGYRDDADALYQPWLPTTPASPDATEQSAAYNAALANITTDAAIQGVFFWGWSRVGGFSLANQPATAILSHYFTALAAKE